MNNNNDPNNNPQHPVNPQPRPVNPQQRPVGAQPAGPQPRPAGPQPRPVNPPQRPVGAQPAGPQPRPAGPQPRPVNPQQSPVGAQPAGPQPRPVNPPQRPVGAQPAGPQPRPAGPQPRPVNPQQSPVGNQPMGPQPRPVSPQPQPLNPQQRPVGAQPAGPQPRPAGPQPRPAGPQPRPVGPQLRPVNPQQRPVPLQSQTGNNDSKLGTILGGVGAVSGVAGAVMGGMALYKQNQLEKKLENGEFSHNGNSEFNTSDPVESFLHKKQQEFLDETDKKMRLNIDENDRISSFHEEYFKTIGGKRIVIVDIISIEDAERYSVKLEEILNLFYDYNPIQDYTYENISATLSSIRNDSQAVPGLPARVSEFLGIDEDNNILIFKPYKSPEQPDFSYEQKQQILSNRERVVEIKKKLLGKKLFISNQGKTYIKDSWGSNAGREAQKNLLLHVLESEGIIDWLRGDEYSDVEEAIKKLIRNFSFGDNYPILFDNQIALLPDEREFIRLKENN